MINDFICCTDTLSTCEKREKKALSSVIFGGTKFVLEKVMENKNCLLQKLIQNQSRQDYPIPLKPYWLQHYLRVKKYYGRKMADSGSIMLKFRCARVVNINAKNFIDLLIDEDDTEEDSESSPDVSSN
ncbi:glutamyl-tRNA(Gln) amidotransferase subunit B [Striga asiatica]|uniref:Glutamyl-tRNA(Gln) amidotransferase subunit B n=1 Tax=Striga asiatica TaxID=4170 RepID=A0A5A7NYZ1_STRAF|nr:glutamyl-tRNA(Gln) amidotransferase subunit B [Striga asiatica]